MGKNKGVLSTYILARWVTDLQTVDFLMLRSKPRKAVGEKHEKCLYCTFCLHQERKITMKSKK